LLAWFSADIIINVSILSSPRLSIHGPFQYVRLIIISLSHSYLLIHYCLLAAVAAAAAGALLFVENQQNKQTNLNGTRERASKKESETKENVKIENTSARDTNLQFRSINAIILQLYCGM
jgi:hypothetical protein